MALGKRPIEIVNEGIHQLLVKADHWERIELKKVARVQNGFAFSSDNFSKAEGTPLIRIRDIDRVTTVDKYIGSFNKDFIVKIGDVLIGMDGDFKAAIWKGPDALLNQRVCRIIPYSETYDARFLFFCLQPFLNAINSETSSVTVKHLSSKTIEEIPLPFPPIKEQHQIVQKIEELFSELDKGIENLKTAQQQLKVFRQGVLKWAFEGKLTNEDVVDDELPEGWKWVKLKDACDKIQDGSHFSPQVQYDDPGEKRYMYITAKNIRNNYMDFRKLYYVDEEYHQSIYNRCNPEYGDVLLTKDGINTGDVTLNTLKEPFSLLSSVCLFKPKKGILKAELLKYFIQSPFGNQAILQSMTGTAIKRIVLGKIKNAEISLPPFSEQVEIISEIENRLSVCDKIEESIKQSLQQAELLRQSILKKAFEGKLVKTEVQAAIAKVVSISNSTTETDWLRKVLTGKIIFSFNKNGYIGRTKLQKILYLCENYAQLDYKTAYIKEAAGPLDSKFLYSFLEEAKQKNWIEETHESKWYKYEPGTSISELTKDYPKYFRSKSDKIQFVIKQLHDKDTDTCELIATIYAIWNNYVIENKELNSDLLIKEVYEWDDSKFKFNKQFILSTWALMKNDRLQPAGFGQLIKHTN